MAQALDRAIDYVFSQYRHLSDAPTPMPDILTANRLSDGDVVYRTAPGDWVADVDAAELIDGAARLAVAEAAAQADVKAAKVLDVATIAVEVTDGHIVPKRLRERIRAFGPTVKSDHRPGAI
ncbi:DUF2849 domain-containing protein [Pleomorphomonas sp. PLEO]|uniref:DUF2849 domain-containing protein n=1 Tax=Pleomorphomonas sp. PLEO TaxID=3239306 RepID=UPI00351ECD74